jgi:hypothetical protein
MIGQGIHRRVVFNPRIATMMFEKELKVFRKLVSFGSRPTPETFRELPDCMVWMRFVMAVSYSVYVFWHKETENSRGAVPLLMALNFVAFVPLLYCRVVLLAEAEAYGGGQLIFNGLANAMALVLLMWIYFYTLVSVR